MGVGVKKGSKWRVRAQEGGVGVSVTDDNDAGGTSRVHALCLVTRHRLPGR